MNNSLWLVLLFLAGCDQVQQRMGFPDPVQIQADGKAIGGACRNAGRGLEDCFHLNPDASKAAIFIGWKEMNEYMVKNKLPIQIPSLTADVGTAEPPKAKDEEKGGDKKKHTEAKKSPDAGKKSDQADADAGN